MINIENYLRKNIKDKIGCYALVTYQGKTEAVWFSNFSNINKRKNIFFLESPCELAIYAKGITDIDQFCKQYVQEIELECKEIENQMEYIEKYIRPMIVDGIFYEIENFQVAPYLPKEVDNIVIVSEKECLNWLLQAKKEKMI